MQRVQTTSAMEATNALFDQALPDIPMWNQARIENEFEGFKRAWGSKRLIPGTKESLRKLVQSNLETTTLEFGFHFFTVDVMDHLGCGQVVAWSDGNGASVCLWRSESGLHLCGNFFFKESLLISFGREG
jgi:hypothetical protein